MNKNVLIPRQETEILVQKAMDMIKSNDEVLDIGAGCGNISIILAKHTGIKVVAVEKCKKAIYVLKKNILLHNVKDKIIPVKADLFPVSPKKFNLIISNPPYVSEPEWKQLPPGINKYEPKHALVAGAKGTEILDRIIKNAKTHLKSRGKLLIEIGYDQRSSVYKKLKDSDYSQVSFFYDLNNIPRVVLAQL